MYTTPHLKVFRVLPQGVQRQASCVHEAAGVTVVKRPAGACLLEGLEVQHGVTQTTCCVCVCVQRR